MSASNPTAADTTADAATVDAIADQNLSPVDGSVIPANAIDFTVDTDTLDDGADAGDGDEEADEEGGKVSLLDASEKKDALLEHSNWH